jgi:4-amino-4-deoxy-L-arabinose transferase-like glycosyltransferase
VTRRALAGIGAGALAARVVFVALFLRDYRPKSDAANYFELAQALSRGRGFVATLPFEYVHATAERPPLYPAVASVFLRIFGEHVGVAQGVNIVAGAIAAVLGALLAARLAGPRAGLVAGWVIALYPTLVANDVTLLVESFAVVLTFVAVLLLLDGRMVLAGVAIGLLVLDRASAQWLVVLLALWLIRQVGWAHAAVFVATAVVVVSPWVARNWVHVGGPTLVTTNGFNLNATFSEEADHAGHFVDGYLDARFANIRYAAADEIDLDTGLRNHALHHLRRHPIEVPRVVGNGLARWFEVVPAWNTDAERLDGRNLDVRAWTLPLFYVVTAAGLAGLIVARRRPGVALLWLVAGYFTVVCVLSISVPRLRSVFDAVMAVGVGLLAASWSTSRDDPASETDATRVVVRDPHPLRTLGVLALVLVLVAGGGLVWKRHTERAADAAARAAVARDAGAIDAVGRALAVARAQGAPPAFARADLDRLDDLVVALGTAAPEASAAWRTRIARALVATRIVTHETHVIGLLSAGEDLAAAAQHRRPTLARVARRYERDVRPHDPPLHPFDLVARGVLVDQAAAALGALRTGAT